MAQEKRTTKFCYMSKLSWTYNAT